MKEENRQYTFSWQYARFATSWMTIMISCWL
jgi:hypothetical protein